MSLAIDYSSDGNINLNLLKSEIDRRVFRILGMLNEVFLPYILEAINPSFIKNIQQSLRYFQT